MFKKISSSKPQQQQTPQLDPKTAAIIEAIREQSKRDPLIGAKLGAKEVLQRLINGMKNERGVHAESLLSVLGALAGYSCQANLRAQALAKGMPETAALQTVETNDGTKYFLGEPLNDALIGSQYSVWGLAAGAAQQAGCKELPDINELFQHSISAMGSDQFGIPRVPENHRAADSPINYLTAIWPALIPTVKLFCPNPVDWPILFSLAIQEAIDTTKSVIDPGLSLKIVMESAIPMAHVNLANSRTSH